MANAIDIKYINPFLKATITILEMLGMGGAKVGKPSLSKLEFPDTTFLIQVGLTGDMKGQAFLVMNDDRAKQIASIMMMGMPVETLDAMACSALGELGNMVLGNTATIFSTMGIIVDITPPLSMHGKKLKLSTDNAVFCIPILLNEQNYITLYLAVAENKDK